MGCIDTISFYHLSQKFFYFHVYENFVVEWRMDPCICMAKSLHCSPEIITSLLVGYTPVQSKKCFCFCFCFLRMFAMAGYIRAICMTEKLEIGRRYRKAREM